MRCTCLSCSSTKCWSSLGFHDDVMCTVNTSWPVSREGKANLSTPTGLPIHTSVHKLILDTQHNTSPTELILHASLFNGLILAFL